VDHLLSGGKEGPLFDVRARLGENSPQWQMIQKDALKRVLRAAIFKRPSGEQAIKGDAISGALSKYTKAEQDMLFPNNLRESLLQLGDDVNFLFPYTSDDFGGSLKAAAIKSEVPWKRRAVMHWLLSKAEGYITDHPRLLGFIAATHVSDPSLSAQIAKTLGRWMINAEIQDPAGQ
jgi:hypothetical protein